MGEIIVQIYGIALIYSTMCRLLEPKSKSRRYWMRHLAAAGLLFLIDMLQWYAAVAAAKADSAWVDFVRSISRFATQYMFLAAAHWIFCGSYVKLFSAYFLSGFLFEILFAASQLILTPLRPKEMPWLSFEANSIYTLWLLLSITALGLCLSPLLKKQMRKFRSMDVGGTLPEKAAAWFLWIVLGTGYLPNRANMEFYGFKMFLNIAFWIVGNAICGALILWNEYQAEKRRNQSIRLQTQLLKEHEKVMEAQIQFSRRLQQEIREQLEKFSREKRSLPKTEVRNYYERLLELSKSGPQKEYNSNPIINQFLIQKIGEWERDGHRVSVLHHAPRICATNTTAWLKALQRLFQEMDHQSLRQHSAVVLRMDSALGHELFTVQYEAGKRIRKRTAFWLGGMLRRYGGGFEISEKKGRYKVVMEMEA